MFQPIVGERLDNGALILERHYSTAKGWIVLCDFGGVHPYVTWQLDTRGNADWGHYHATLEDAQNEFAERTGQKVKATV